MPDGAATGFISCSLRPAQSEACKGRTSLPPSSSDHVMQAKEPALVRLVKQGGRIGRIAGRGLILLRTECSGPCHSRASAMGSAGNGPPRNATVSIQRATCRRYHQRFLRALRTPIARSGVMGSARLPSQRASIMAEQASSPVGPGLALSSQFPEVSAVKHCVKAQS